MAKIRTENPAAVMNANDAVNGRKAELYATINGKRYNLMMFTQFEAKYSKTKAKVQRLGTPTVGHKTISAEGTWTAKAYYNQSEFRKCAEEFSKTGVDPVFEIQAINNDTASAAGEQEIFYYGCTTDTDILSKIDASGEVLEEDLSGTFDGFTMSEEFDHLSGFEAAK